MWLAILLWFKSSEHIRMKVDRPYFQVSNKKSLISDPVMTLQRKPEENMVQFLRNSNRQSNQRLIYIKMGSN